MTSNEIVENVLIWYMDFEHSDLGGLFSGWYRTGISIAARAFAT